MKTQFPFTLKHSQKVTIQRLKTTCYPERSEGSLQGLNKILRCAHNDGPLNSYFTVVAKISIFKFVITLP
ncbi:protein of unknown function [Tepidanaerobacter acetatoxydans Re1]|uniref:Uncharacterized protein n=1 Tax=Tepidanaerobacter acetatoxydans (strain DSM 21804 / JCM 16047 / Re1) TaxID=1209989 RepID=U4QDD5_TEPAE|nr:protein of unknown function [Tepidanaerobacter acetatoxydans Re1]